MNHFQHNCLRTVPGYLSTNEVLAMGALGLCGEAGETAELIKKAMYQRHYLSVTELAEELGDVMWYVAVTAWAAGLDLERIMELNEQKRKRRYPVGFTAERSKNREVQNA